MGDIDIKRFLVSFLICMGIMFVWFRFFGPASQPPPPAPTQPVKSAPADTAAPAATTPQEASTEPAVAAAPTQPTQWALQKIDDSPPPIVIGRLDPDQRYKAQITFDTAAAAISTVYLSEHKLNVKDKENGYPLLLPVTHKKQTFNSLMLGQLKLKNRAEAFDLSTACWQAEEPLSSDEVKTVKFRATVIDEKNRPVLEIVKTFTYRPDDYELDFDLSFINRSAQSLEIESLELIGPAGAIREDQRMERRKSLAVYLQENQEVDIQSFDLGRSKEANETLKRDTGSTDPILWFALSNKFFTAVVRPLPPAHADSVDYLEKGGRVLVTKCQIHPNYRDNEGTIKADESLITQTLLTPAAPLGIGSQSVFNFKVYLGAIDTDLFNTETYASLHFDKLLNTYACTFCAFDWLTALLLKMLKAFYAVIGNYGLAIIILVLLVRLVLHPITKKGQVNMMSMSKLGPRMEELKKKYGDNKAELQKQTMAMYKEQGFNPVLGCLPMLLQMPIWIAIYTAVDASVGLRHEGLFSFWINDLSAPDRLIPFSVLGIKPITLPLMIGYVDAINLLPILMAFAMYLQTKLTAQPTATASPQMAQQQKMMKILMPVMMLVFLYCAPSGLNLYIMASTFGGVFESYIIRKHIREQEEKKTAVTTQTTTKVSKRLEPKKKKPKPPVRFN